MIDMVKRRRLTQRNMMPYTVFYKGGYKDFKCESDADKFAKGKEKSKIIRKNISGLRYR